MILALKASGSGSLFIYKSVKNSPFAIRKIQTMEFIAETIADLSPSLTLSITSQAKQMREDGIDVCNLGAGEPDFDTPQHLSLIHI